ncbi:MAG: 50S ribosomal protein L9 [Rickettsiales bacterium]|jgi:large subunit ribosomal protein L9|nr:50S ribosomal protein L9 [Rickettsiales bacterium]
MEIILLEKVGRLGHLGDKVVVKDGYARNYLIPFKKALRATKANLERFESQKVELAAANTAALAKATADAAKLEGKSFVIIRQAGDTGHLYGSVSTRDVAAAVAQSGVAIDYSRITIDTPIKELGIYKVRAALHPEVVLDLKVNVARSEAEAKVAEEAAEAAAKKALEKVAEPEIPAVEAAPAEAVSEVGEDVGEVGEEIKEEA